MRHPRQVLVVYKKSIYQIYFLEHRRSLRHAHLRFTEAELERMLEAHHAHLASLARVQQELRQRRLRHRTIYRTRRLDFAPFDLVVSVGGDGTLIEAARRVTGQAVVGVNSDPRRSAGALCATTAADFGGWLDALAAGRARFCPLNRMHYALNDVAQPFPALNDLLIADAVPAAMSRYELRIGERCEVQRGSGLWICTAGGSTGAVLSAGGRRMPRGSRRLQVLAREPFARNAPGYELGRSIVPAGAAIEVRSLMRQGMVFADGPHLRTPFPHGAVLTVTNSPWPLRLAQPLPQTDPKA